MDKTSKPPEEALNYLREFGLDPMEISRDDWDEIGYYEVLLDRQGKRIWLEGRPASEKVWREWPEEFNPRYFKRLLKGA